MRIIAFIFICSVTAIIVQAQSLYNNSLISIGSTSVLFVSDSLVNNGILINNGDMQIGGAWINNDQYDAGQGKITFNSDLPQVINHNDQSFSRLTISGGGQKIFQANITIENELNLSDGVLTSANGSVIVIQNGATVSGGSDQAHINGMVYQQGSGNKIFPVGDGSVYLPLELLNIEGASAEVGVRVVDLNGITLSHARSLEKISTNRYWELDVVSGSVAQSRVTLPVVDESIVTNDDEVVVAQSSSLTSDFETLGRSPASTVNGKVTSNDFVTAKFLAIGTVEHDGSISVYNAISSGDDGLNDFMRIHNIESFPDNIVRIYNRWGDLVFEVKGYTNDEKLGKVFRGKRNVGGSEDLPAGTYFYVIQKKEGDPAENGYLSLKN
jgi:gliding motility-associated-like protein